MSTWAQVAVASEDSFTVIRMSSTRHADAPIHADLASPPSMNRIALLVLHG